MKFSLALETAIIVIKYGITPIFSWPLSPEVSTLSILRRNICWWLAIVHMIVSTIPYLYTIYINTDNPVLVMKILSEVAALASLITKMMICKIEATRIQGLLADLQAFLQLATNEETELIQFYVDKCLCFHASVFACSIIGPAIFIGAPLLTAQPLPATCSFPFSIDSVWIWGALYFSESILMIQAGSTAVLDSLYAVLLWFAGARFEMLSIELERARNADDVALCIRKHQELLEYVERLKATTRIMALEVTAVGMFAVTTGGFVLIHDPPLLVLLKYACFEIVAGLELFLYTWPADNLIVMSEKIGAAAFRCAWIGKSRKMVKNLSIIMQRARIPMIIAVHGIVPTLSLQFYGSAMSACFSYVTTLRAMTGN